MGIISDFPWGMEHRRPHSDSSSLWKSKIGAERGGECALLVVDGRRRKIAETSEGPRYDDVTPRGESVVRARLDAERRHAKLCSTEHCRYSTRDNAYSLSTIFVALLTTVITL